MTPRPAQRELLLACALAAAVVAVFGLSLWAPFIYDDRVYVLDNPEVVGPWRGWAHWIRAPLFDHGEYEPLVSLIHRGLFSAFGASVAAFRLSNLVLHVAAVLSFFALARALLASSAYAFAAAALFALYPGQAELMAVSTFKKHLLVALAGLGMLALELGRWRPAPRLSGQAALFALALLVKESALMLPALPAAAALAGLAPRRPRRERALLAALLAAAALAYALWRAAVAPRLVPALEGGLAAHLATSGKCLLWYLRELILPLSLCQEQSLSPVREALSRDGALVALGLWAAGAALVRLWRRDRLLGLSAAWTLASLAPFLNLFPYLSVSLVANRYLYLASAGFALGVARAAQLWGARVPRAMAAAAGAVAVLYAGQASAQLARYSDPVELWTRTVRCAPGNPRAELGLGVALNERGKSEEAAAHFRRALELAPSGYGRWGALQLAVLESDAGRQEKARALAAVGEPALPAVAQGIIGMTFMREGRFREAVPRLGYAIKFSPQLAELRVLLGQCHHALGEHDKAAALWRESLEIPSARARAELLLAELARERARKERRAKR